MASIMASNAPPVIWLRLTEHVWFPVSDCETLSPWILQKLDQVASTGVPSNVNSC
jgi:hypothetical protein